MEFDNGIITVAASRLHDLWLRQHRIDPMNLSDKSFGPPWHFLGGSRGHGPVFRVSEAVFWVYRAQSLAKLLLAPATGAELLLASARDLTNVFVSFGAFNF